MGEYSEMYERAVQRVAKSSINNDVSKIVGLLEKARAQSSANSSVVSKIDEAIQLVKNFESDGPGNLPPVVTATVELGEDQPTDLPAPELDASATPESGNFGANDPDLSAQRQPPTTAGAPVTPPVPAMGGGLQGVALKKSLVIKSRPRSDRS